MSDDMYMYCDYCKFSYLIDKSFMWNSIPPYSNLIFLINMHVYLLALLITFLKLILPLDTVV